MGVIKRLLRSDYAQYYFVYLVESIICTIINMHIGILLGSFVSSYLVKLWIGIGLHFTSGLVLIQVKKWKPEISRLVLYITKNYQKQYSIWKKICAVVILVYTWIALQFITITNETIFKGIFNWVLSLFIIDAIENWVVEDSPTVLNFNPPEIKHEYLSQQVKLLPQLPQRNDSQPTTSRAKFEAGGVSVNRNSRVFPIDNYYA